MLDAQKAYFAYRRESELHQDEILNAEGGNKAERYFRRLVARVFTYHIEAVPYLEEPEWPKTLKDDEIPPRECISYLFHSKYFCPVTISAGIAGGQIDLERFIAEITRTSGGSRENNVRYVIGDVGVGKSSFMSNLIVTRGKAWVLENNIVPIRIDFDVEAGHLPFSVQKLLCYIYEKVIEAFQVLHPVGQEDLDKIIADTALPNVRDIEQALASTVEASLSKLITRLEGASGKRILLILDNLDYLYHLYDRGLFALSTSIRPLTAEQKELLQRTDDAHLLINYIIKMFVENNNLSKLGLNALVVLRQDSLMHYINVTRVEVPPQRQPLLHTYRISTPTLEAVYMSHVDLLVDTIERLPDNPRRAAYLEAAHNLRISPYEKTIRHKLMADMTGLARQGLRHLMMHYSKFVWLPIGIDEDGQRYKLIKRFTDQYAPPLLAFLLNGKRLFTQFVAQFPNMYLVRSDCHEERDIPWSSLLKPHRHTYWLKRLLLQYAAHLEAEGEELTPKSVVDTFCGSDGKGWFEESIVRLCLGSLSQAESSHVFELEFAPSENVRGSHIVKNIRLTNRGWHLVKGFLDTFIYLQLVVDDYSIPIPRCVSDEFRYDQVDYGYLVSHPSLYSRKARDLVRAKVRQVLIFLEILRASLECEKRVYSKAIAHLEGTGMTLPNIAHIDVHVRNDMVKILDLLGLQIEDSFSAGFQKDLRNKLGAELPSAYDAGDQT
jgi:hypothetical protein